MPSRLYTASFTSKVYADHLGSYDGVKIGLHNCGLVLDTQHEMRILLVDGNITPPTICSNLFDYLSSTYSVVFTDSSTAEKLCNNANN